jgi:hypothetical protein
VTSYEDLPADLFGEPDDPPAAPPPGGEAAKPSAPAGEVAAGGRPETREADTDREAPVSRGAARTDPDPNAAEGADGRSPLAMVQSLFPGRIVAIEPLDGPDDASADAEGADAPPEPEDAGANDPDDGPPAASG